MIASSLGGPGIASTAITKHKEHNTPWDADGGDRIVGAILVRLEAKGHQGSVQLVRGDDSGTQVAGADNEKDRYEDSPLPDSVVWKGGRYTNLDSTGASPLI